MPIRKAELSDIETILWARRNEPQLRLEEEPEEVVQVRLEKNISENRGCCLVDEEDGNVSAFIYAKHLESYGSKWAEIDYLYVDPSYRRRCIGNELYKKCEAELKGNGYTRIIFLTHHDNKVIKFMARQFGFELLETRGYIEFYGKNL